MKIEELMAGNYVKCKVSNDAGVYKVIAASLHTEMVEIYGGARNGEKHQVETIGGVPLTPEILVKCGFVAISAYLIKRITEDIIFRYSPSEGIIVEDQVNRWGWVLHPIKHLHQLQNLFLLITGEPLNVEL